MCLSCGKVGHTFDDCPSHQSTDVLYSHVWQVMISDWLNAIDGPTNWRSHHFDCQLSYLDNHWHFYHQLVSLSAFVPKVYGDSVSRGGGGLKAWYWGIITTMLIVVQYYITWSSYTRKIFHTKKAKAINMTHPSWLLFQLVVGIQSTTKL